MTENRLKQFGWKRKAGEKVSKSTSSAFEGDCKDEEDPAVINGDVDWLTLAPTKKKTVMILEDGKAKANRLVQEGTVLGVLKGSVCIGDIGIYWEALKKWDEALLYTPCDDKIHDMKAQALMELGEVYPAVQAAKKAVEYNPTWWVGHQTLGRALLGLGEVRMAVRSFSRAVHLNPGEQELWEEDLMWAWSLLQKRQRLDEEKKKKLQTQLKSGVKIKEIDDSDEDGDGDNVDVSQKVLAVFTGENEPSDRFSSKEINTKSRRIKKLPNSYVQMRDQQPP